MEEVKFPKIEITVELFQMYWDFDTALLICSTMFRHSTSFTTQPQIRNIMGNNNCKDFGHT